MPVSSNSCPPRLWLLPTSALLVLEGETQQWQNTYAQKELPGIPQLLDLQLPAACSQWAIPSVCYACTLCPFSLSLRDYEMPKFSSRVWTSAVGRLPKFLSATSADVRYSQDLHPFFLLLFPCFFHSTLFFYHPVLIQHCLFCLLCTLYWCSALFFFPKMYAVLCIQV